MIFYVSAVLDITKFGNPIVMSRIVFIPGSQWKMVKLQIRNIMIAARKLHYSTTVIDYISISASSSR